MDPARARIYPFTSPAGAVPFFVERSEGAWLVTPDILVSGKGPGGGYAPIAERGDDRMFYTYSAHPGACAAAEKVLEASITSAVARVEA